MRGMHGCNVCKWVESGQKPKTRMMAPAKCNCIPEKDKDPQFLQKTFSAMNKEKVSVTVDADEGVVKEVKDILGGSIQDIKLPLTTIAGEVITAKPKRRGRPPKAKV